MVKRPTMTTIGPAGPEDQCRKLARDDGGTDFGKSMCHFIVCHDKIKRKPKRLFVSG